MAVYIGGYHAAVMSFLPIIIEAFYSRQLPGLSLILDPAKPDGSAYLGSRSSLCRTLIIYLLDSCIQSTALSAQVLRAMHTLSSLNPFLRNKALSVPSIRDHLAQRQILVLSWSTNWQLLRTSHGDGLLDNP